MKKWRVSFSGPPLRWIDIHKFTAEERERLAASEPQVFIPMTPEQIHSTGVIENFVIVQAEDMIIRSGVLEFYIDGDFCRAFNASSWADVRREPQPPEDD